MKQSSKDTSREGGWLLSSPSEHTTDGRGGTRIWWWGWMLLYSDNVRCGKNAANLHSKSRWDESGRGLCTDGDMKVSDGMDKE